MSLMEKFKNGLVKTRANFSQQLDNLFKGKKIDENFFEELEESLIMSDVGVDTSLKIIEELKTEIHQNKITEPFEVKNLLIQKMADLFDYQPEEDEKIKDSPHVILVIGVNGSGKTTTIGKLAYRWRNANKKVMLVAGDTFRAAAIEQLEIWAQRVSTDFIKQQTGSDPSSVFFDALNAARSRGVEIVIGDTAGRLHTKVNLMEELKKVYRVNGKVMNGAPHEVLLVIDATTGQNGLVQAKKFSDAVPVSGVVLTKLDGTAKGGIVLAIKEQLGIPVKYVGLGENIEDLEIFDPTSFVKALLD